MHTDHTTQTQADKRQDAQALQMRLYREIGISAVAAALQVSVDKPAPAPQHPLPAILRGDDLAA